jgi:hypothetical protein
LCPAAHPPYADRVAVDWPLYGDFFPIEGFGVVVLGAGKTKAGKVAAGIHPAGPASTDTLELGRDGPALVCRNVGPQAFPSDSPWLEWARIDYLALCLREQGTDLNFRDRQFAVIETDLETFKSGARWYLAFPSQDQAEARAAYFSSLVDDADLAGFVVVPWMASHEEKGELMRRFFAHRRDART